MISIQIFKITGRFAENKDVARGIRMEQIVPALRYDQKIVLDFKNVDSATQSFIHVLISDLIRVYGSDVLDRISFKSCNETIQKIIGIVVDYMQEGA